MKSFSSYKDFSPLFFRGGALEDVFHFTEIQIMLGLLLAAFILDSWYCGLQLTAYWGTIKNKKRKCVWGGAKKKNMVNKVAEK